MRKLLLVLLTAMSITACSTIVEPWEYRWAMDMCGDNGGIKKMEVFSIFYPNVVCNNGAHFSGDVYNTEEARNSD